MPSECEVEYADTLEPRVRQVSMYTLFNLLEPAGCGIGVIACRVGEQFLAP
jgi:hypothetical protein